MAHDTLLADLLSAEPTRGDDEAYADAVCAYLESYREAFGFDSVFLVSTESNRYYHFNGVDRTLERHNPGTSTSSTATRPTPSTSTTTRQPQTRSPCS